MIMYRFSFKILLYKVSDAGSCKPLVLLLSIFSIDVIMLMYMLCQDFFFKMMLDQFVCTFFRLLKNVVNGNSALQEME